MVRLYHLKWCFTSDRANITLSDDLPIRGFIGHLEEGSILPHNHKTYLWTHLHFAFEYNGDQVISSDYRVERSHCFCIAGHSQRQYLWYQPSAIGRGYQPTQGYLHLQR